MTKLKNTSLEYFSLATLYTVPSTSIHSILNLLVNQDCYVPLNGNQNYTFPWIGSYFLRYAAIFVRNFTTVIRMHIYSINLHSSHSQIIIIRLLLLADERVWSFIAFVEAVSIKCMQFIISIRISSKMFSTFA